MTMVAIRLDPASWDGIDAQTEALLDHWDVAVGDRVAAGQAVGGAVLVKSNLELTAPAAGRIARLEVAAEQTFGRDAALAWIDTSA